MPIRDREPDLHPEDLLDGFCDDHHQKDHKWWVLHTRPRQEKSLARSLLASEVPFYLPTVAKDNLIRGKRVWSYVPVFASYVFLFGTESDRLRALQTNRVVHVLDVADAKALVIDLRQVQRLIQSDAALTVERRIQPGQMVRIKKGPMMGLEGTVESRKGRTHLIVAVRMLQQGISLEIDDMMIEPI